MAGIISYSAYVPFYRLNRAEIARAWDSYAMPGEKAIANFDEDSLTMAVEAARECTQGIDLQGIDGVFFASTTAPYKDKQTAATVATVLGIKRDVITVDFGGSTRSGTNALRMAMDAVKGDSAKSILVCAADTRMGYPTGMNEMNFGDGAAAVLVGNEETAVQIEDTYSIYEELQDFWRSDRDIFVRSAEDRFIIDEGYHRVVPQAVSGALKKFKLTAKDFTKCVVYLPAQRQIAGVVSKLGFNPATQSKDNLFSAVGDAGSAMALMSLVQALEESKPGDRILLSAYGNGCDVFSIKVVQSVQTNGNRKSLAQYLASKKMLSNYNKYLRWRELVTVQPPPRPAIEYRHIGPQAQWKENDKELRLCGTKCLNCGTPQYPPQRVCVACGAKDKFEYYPFADKIGKLTSFSHDHVVATIDPPATVAIVDFEGGGRIRLDMTDRDPAECKVGMPVKQTFRKLFYVNGIYNYWWKCTPRL